MTARYPDQYNPDLLARIPLDARSVLDVGCGSAALGLEYKRRNPAARYFGIEADSDAAAIAGTRIDRVAVGDVELHLRPFGDERFDCIVFGDLLEHLRDPWAVLRTHAGLLTAGGVMLICMPNLEHWVFAARLLQGGWDYHDQGLMDRSHLRCFTPDTTHRALLEAGLVPLDVAPRIFDRAQAEQFTRAIEPALRALGTEPSEYLRRAAPIQHVWRAGAGPVAPLDLVSSMLPPIGGVSEVRVVEPMAALATQPGLTVRIAADLNPPEPAGGDGARIFILHRPLLLGAEGLAPLRQLLRAGWLLVCEFDDHPDYIPVLMDQDVRNFSAVHAVQTSTSALGEVLRARNPEVAVFPNGLARLDEPANYGDPDRLVFSFAGLNREADWPPYIDAINAVARMARERLWFRVIADRGFFEALDTPHKEYLPLCDYETYKSLLGQSEIAFMPLADTPFNRCKSDLKFIEASAHRVTALASRVVYADSVEDGRSGSLFSGSAELHHKLMALVADPLLGMSMADAARAHVARHRMLAYQVGRRVAWYRSLWDRREELHRALLERTPELA